MPRPIYPQRGEGPARGLADGAVGTSELADSAVTTVKLAAAAVVGPKLGADSAGLTAVADPVRRRTMTVHLGAAVTGADNVIQRIGI